MDALVDRLFTNVLSGIGSSGKIRLKGTEIDDVLRKGGRWAVEHGMGETPKA
jgi:tRNA-splicing ligase RtcB